MKALIKKKPGIGLFIDEIPCPEIRENEVLIKTKMTSLCGTDIHIYKWDEWASQTLTLPRVIGHEFMGEIVQVGKHVKSVKEGDRVTGEGHITCGQCLACHKGLKHLCYDTQGLGVQIDGCFADYFAFPAENLFPLPPFISDEIGAILDPFGNAVHAALSFPLAGQDILITGAGPIGIMASAISRKAGAHRVVITDRSDFRLGLAKKMGATDTVNVDKQSLNEVMKNAGISNGFSIALEMSGNPQALEQVLQTTSNGAHIVLLGILPTSCTFDWDQIIFKMLNIKGIFGREIFGTWYQMVNLLDSGIDLAPLITHRFPAVEYEKAFAAAQTGHSGKVILIW